MGLTTSTHNKLCCVVLGFAVVVVSHLFFDSSEIIRGAPFRREPAFPHMGGTDYLATES
jgi:hypothetical protein